jgi:acyl carrier protein
MFASTATVDSLKEAFVESIGLSENTDWPTVQYGAMNGWDSMAHMQLITVIETRFNIMLSTDEVIALGSFEKAKEIIASHGVVFES